MLRDGQITQPFPWSFCLRDSQLDRVEIALARERQLTSNIGHELKTPIAELRNLCEVGGRWPDDPVAMQQFFADAQSISVQMDRIVSNLLLLARYETGKAALVRKPVVIGELLASNWGLVEATAKRRGLRLIDQIPLALSMRTDPEILSLIFSNLLMNAASYACEGTDIDLSASQHAGTVTVCIANKTDSLARKDLDRMFDRFWRKDTARTGGGHLGLGLALVRAFADVLDIRIDCSLDDSGNFAVCLVFER